MSVTTHKKLIEVALPLEAIDAACKADKDRKTGTIRNLHKWFAPMPVPAWRALLFAALVDDPGNAADRERLRRLIEDLVATGADAPPAHVLASARAEIHRSNPKGLPIVLDPFCGGGSTLVEAQRLDLPAHGSDLNPVPVLISRTLCDLVPAALKARDTKNPNRLLEASLSDLRDDVLRHARAVGERVRSRIAHLYPPLEGDLVPYAWIWTRTAPCPNPSCRLTTPLVTSWCLSAKRGAEVFVQPVVVRDHVEFEVTRGDADTFRGAKVGRAAFGCVRCATTLTTSYLREVAKHDGLGCRLLAIAAMKGKSRLFIAPTPAQEESLRLDIEVEPFLRVPITKGGLGIRVPLWGMDEQADLYLPRQVAALTAFADESASVYDRCIEEGSPPEHALLIATTLGIAVSRLAMHNSMQVKWFTRNGPSKADPALREANLPIVWTFAETNPFAGSVGDWMQVVETTAHSFDSLPSVATSVSVDIADARTAASDLALSSCLVATDPPYFGHIGYADLSDYFYVWLRRALQAVHPDLFNTIAAPRAGELVANPARHDGDEEAARTEYVNGFIEAFASLSRAQRSDLPMLIVYAHREHEGAQGWEAMLTAVIESGLQIVGTWPIEASRSDRLRTYASNAMAAYVVLVCRPRDQKAAPVSFRDFDRELRTTLQAAVRDLQEAATAPVDLAQAVIGPGMAVFSKHSAVLTAGGSALPVDRALGQINRVLSEILDEQESDFDAATRFAVAWFEQHGTAAGKFGEADQLARAKNTAVNGLVEDGIIESRPGSVRLLGRAELDPQWDPVSDNRLTVWETTHHLVKRLEEGGDLAAADLLSRVGIRADGARDLAYRLYAICERKGWAREAQGYNALAAAWGEIRRLSEGHTNAPQQTLGV